MPENSTVQTDGTPDQGEAAAAPNQPEQQQSGWSMAKGFIFRMVMMYMVMSFFRQPSQPANTTTDQNAKTSAYKPSFNLYPEGTKFEMHMFICEMESCEFGDLKPFYTQYGLIYGDWNGGEKDDSTYVYGSKVTTSENLLNNGSIFLHLYVLESNKGDLKANLNSNRLIHKTHQLNKYKKRKFVSTSNLLTGKTDVQPDLVKKENSTEVAILSHWHPNISINYVMDQTPWTQGSLPKPLDEYVEFMEDGTAYKPVVFFNTYWNLQTDYKPINETTPELNLTVTIYPLSMFKWQFYSAQGMRNQWYSQFLGEGGAEQSDEEQDVLKTTILETNPYLLVLTMCVSLVHSVFEFLAFKNDIQFWKDRKTLEGLSVRSVFFSVFQSLIVLLYILDNETNFVVIISVFIGLLIDVWKITKVVNVKLDHEDKWLDSIPKLKIEDKSTYVESKTKEYDQMAFKYLSWALFPLLASYGVYSLLYNEHKGWYSWVLSMLYGFLLMFGFIMMTPQLFINYKLKSVAHLPWRMMTYKALNTFIDDLFAFVIKMPTLYRLGCFRDDVVFVIFLYQRYIYKVDPTRVNEFGTTGEMAQEEPTPNAVDSNAETQALIDKPEDEKKTD